MAENQTPTPTLPVALRPVLDRQTGLFTSRQARAVGLRHDELTVLRQVSVIERLCRGVWVERIALGAHPADRHRQLARAGRLLHPDAVLSGTTSVLAQGLPVDGCRLDRAFLLRPGVSGRVVEGFAWRRACRELQVVDTPLGPAESLPTALLRHAMDQGTEVARPAAEEALHRGLVSRAALAAAARLAERMPRSRRATALVAALDTAGGTAAVLLTRVLLLLALDGIPVVRDVEVLDPQTGECLIRAPIGLAGTRVLLDLRAEPDSGADPGRAARQQVYRRCLDLGVVVVTVVPADTVRKAALAEKLARAVAKAGRLSRWAAA